MQEWMQEECMCMNMSCNDKHLSQDVVANKSLGIAGGWVLQKALLKLSYIFQ